MNETKISIMADSALSVVSPYSKDSKLTIIGKILFYPFMLMAALLSFIFMLILILFVKDDTMIDL